MDQINGEIIRRSNIVEFINNKYGLTEEEYYNLVVNGNKDYRPKCPCGNNLKFYGISKGYVTKYCSNKCSNIFKTIPKVIGEVKNEYTSINISTHKGDFNIINPGNIIRINRMSILDQLSGLIIESNDRNFSNYIKNRYSLDIEEYYNLVVNLDINHKEYCKECSKVLKFKSLGDPYGEFCNDSCRSKFIANTDKMKDINRNKINRSIHSIDGKLLSSKNRFISKNKGRKSILYIAYINGYSYVKIGVTVSSLDKRMNYYKNSISYDTIHKLHEGTSDIIADMEYKIKCNFKDFMELGTESFNCNRLKEILKFVKSLK